MQVQATIDSFKTRLITEFAKAYVPGRINLGTGNIVQTAFITPLPHFSTNYVELAYEGTTLFSRWGGGSLSRDMLIGIGIFVGVEFGTAEEWTQASKDVIEIGRITVKCGHLWDDITNTAEPGEMVEESQPSVLEYNDKLWVYMHQQMRVLLPVLQNDTFKNWDD